MAYPPVASLAQQTSRVADPGADLGCSGGPRVAEGDEPTVTDLELRTRADLVAEQKSVSV